MFLPAFQGTDLRAYLLEGGGDLFDLPQDHPCPLHPPHLHNFQNNFTSKDSPLRNSQGRGNAILIHCIHLSVYNTAAAKQRKAVLLGNPDLIHP